MDIPGQGDEIAIASITASAGTSLADALAAIASKPWTKDANYAGWASFFGRAFPCINNGVIDLISSAAFTIGANGATYEVAAATPKTITVQNLSKFEIVGTAVKVLINFSKK